MADATTELDALAFCALGWDDVPVAEGPRSSRFASFRRWLVAPQVEPATSDYLAKTNLGELVRGAHGISRVTREWSGREAAAPKPLIGGGVVARRDPFARTPPESLLLRWARG